MRKILTYAFGAIAGLAMCFSVTSCDEGGDEPVNKNDRDQQLEEIVKVFVNNTVLPTYKNMALKSSALVEDLKAFRKDRTQANLDKACADFLASRSWWEMSEGFLFGPASDFGIDPHIDSWPLDLPALEKYLKTDSYIDGMDSEEGDAWAAVKLGPELLGYHGVEYILFRDGKNRKAAEIEDNYLIYAIAVAGDLRNNCWRLYISWAGEEEAKKLNADMVKRVVEDLEMPVTVGGGELSYGENILRAGKAGSLYPSWVAAAQEIVNGGNTIVDEVGTSKIGKAHTGEDVSYIESPYSHKSITDFYDNIVSVENTYLGGLEGNRGASLHDFMKKVNPTMDTKMLDAIHNAKKAIKEMKEPFVENYKDANCKKAMDACKALDEVLSELKDAIAKS